ncbi:hypothetical protein UPYG_G00053950 [Umbra pygmaea]|uniref:GOST seven transmembrane domain-containing protein n=1 Tax=Umbra pygmaea TaxID=75934 RepID=A0ABD0XBM2_UMBPY
MGRIGDVGLTAFVLLLVLVYCDARRHKLALKDDTRYVVHLNSFGFYANGTLDVNVRSLKLPEDHRDQPVVFSLSKSRVNGVLSQTAEETEQCPLDKPDNKSAEPLILFLIDTKKLRVNVRSFGDQDSVLTKLQTNKMSNKGSGSRKRRDSNVSDQVTIPEGKVMKNKLASEEEPLGDEKNDETSAENKVKQQAIKKHPETLKKAGRIDGRTLDLEKTNGTYSFSFNMVIGQLDEGLYNFNFHYCENKVPDVKHRYTLKVEFIEKNPGGYLSAAQIPLPRLYIEMAGVFFIVSMLWVYTLMKHRFSVFKIHWLMAALAFTKSISLVFHSINYHFINTEGHPIEGWAVMYYITHLLKGALLFITLALIGTGWSFVKYILSDKEKRIFMIVIPLQVLANVAYIIIKSTEEGSSEYALWKEVLFLIDLICCGAILFPVIWSIRHLQEASSTHGNSAMNLEKLQLFRHFQVMIVCYIYFTRIIAILLKVTVPFQWQWCYEFVVEVSTLIFFVLTGYKFRPISNNPYLQLPQDKEDVKIDEVVTESGVLEGISKVKKTSN